MAFKIVAITSCLHERQAIKLSVVICVWLNQWTSLQDKIPFLSCVLKKDNEFYFLNWPRTTVIVTVTVTVTVTDHDGS
jgi:hypothetical protein